MDSIASELQRMSIKKKALSIVFIGHVDAGKSTIGGQILYLSGRIDKRTLDKFEKESREKNRESWYLSWALDSNPEEREKGKTTEVGYASFDLANYTVQILDAPGHKVYVPNMILGVNQADVAVLVISARQNEFESGFEKGGQTREHIYLAKASGIAQICVLVNKMDDPTVNWSSDRYNHIVKSTKKMLQSLFGKDNVTYIPISGFLGLGIDKPLDSNVCPWYQGPSFFTYLDTISMPRDTEAPLFAQVTDVMKDMGSLSVFLRVERGILNKTTVKVSPGDRKLKITSISKEEEEVPDAHPGETVRIKFREAEEVQAGDMITALEYTNVSDSNYFMAQLSILDATTLISKGYSAVMHMGARTVPITIGELYKKENDKIHKVKFAKTGDKLVAEILVPQVIPLEVHAPSRRTGIFTLRDESRTVGFGKVLKIKTRREHP
ncbi:peptide chain release factor subunit 3 [Nematocida homosporus]|uniref:peptide chain release factor subunit 3 n=1 Tax=Nematocida homosporus TaxID=1912981 RepID=UPI002220464E|nr:peptide chain release factor subunit 3 [Nematocida homosporus]KAI5186981.1 peptide chain release factor subunit 3 [Nematocida homosporus]